MFYNAATHDLLPQPSAYGLQEKTLAVLHYTPDQDKASWDFSKSGTFRANSAAEILPEFISFARPLQVNCMLAVPCGTSSKNLLGVILVANKPDGFAEDDTRQLDALGTQVCSRSSKTARLLNAERTRAEQLSVLHAVATAATESDQRRPVD